MEASRQAFLLSLTSVRARRKDFFPYLLSVSDFLPATISAYFQYSHDLFSRFKTTLFHVGNPSGRLHTYAQI